MNFPDTNKIRKPEIEEDMGENVKLLNDFIERHNWKKLINFYWLAFGIVTVSIFVLIVVIRLAFKVF
jgi:hypothetical protein